ncbi:MAG: hypothetical protein KGL15_02660, partial [Acidobacteriota bacterium]|nr:hypothetical protein [Acidobacteriota bacterium]
MQVLEHPREATSRISEMGPEAIIPEAIIPEAIIPEAIIPEAIIPEARRRGRRRRACSALTAIGCAGAAVAVAPIGIGGGSAVLGRSRSPLGSAGVRGPSRAPAPVVAWGDYQGVFHLGDVATGRQLQIAAVPAADSAGGLVAYEHGRVLWGYGKDRIGTLTIATGKMSIAVVRGTSVIASPGGARLYVDQGTTDFLELNAATMRPIRRWAIPARWTASPWVARAVAGGLILMHTGRSGGLGIWRPGHRVQPFGVAVGAYTTLAVYTPPAGGYSLVAWQSRCADGGSGVGSGCPLAITNTATHKTVTVPSPTGYGFTGGAFSPDGTQLAVYVNTDNPSDSFSTPRSELAIVKTATGALRLEPKVKLITEEDAAWATWLPSGRQLLTGALSATYLVDAHSLAARPFYFDPGLTRSFSIMESPDLNFSTLV